jgi:NTE family protein
MAKSPKPVRFINLALQGGGSHGAYTWGVLDRLLDDETIDIEAVSGTSAGAVNAVALASGYATGGRTAAKAKLAALWRRIADANPFNAVADQLNSVSGGWFGQFFNPAMMAMNMMARMVSPYQFNPGNINALRDVLDDLIDWKAVQTTAEFKLFLSATNVRSGRIKIFEQAEITADEVLASACLPQLFQAVEIKGEFYWDGGYMGNPALFPLYYATQSDDLLIVEINPLRRDSVPRSTQEIADRINEISFNSSLFQDLRALEFVTRLLDDHKLDRKRYRRMRVHMISTGDQVARLGAASKSTTDMPFLQQLHDWGYAAADAWLRDSGADLGVRSSVDLHKLVNGL